MQSFATQIPDLDKLYSKFYKVHSEKKVHGANFIDCNSYNEFVLFFLKGIKVY